MAGKPPDVGNLREFGCTVYCLDRRPGKSKFGTRCKKGRLVGFSEESKGYRVWLQERNVVVTAGDVKFYETVIDRHEYEEFLPEHLEELDRRNEDVVDVILSPSGIITGSEKENLCNEIPNAAIESEVEPNPIPPEP